jgi:hypothetical protein
VPVPAGMSHYRGSFQAFPKVKIPAEKRKRKKAASVAEEGVEEEPNRMPQTDFEVKKAARAQRFQEPSPAPNPLLHPNPAGTNSG